MGGDCGGGICMHWLCPLFSLSSLPSLFAWPFFGGGIRTFLQRDRRALSLSHTTEPQHNLRDLFGSKSTPSFDRLIVLLSRSTDAQSSLCERSKLVQKG